MKIFFHLGYPRTGTTFLQKNVFKDNNINFIGRTSNYGRQDKYFYHALFQIMDLSNDQYKREKKKIVSIFKKINFSKNKLNLISEEGIMCQYSWRNNDVKITLKRLIEIAKMTNFNISFFLTIRNQQDCLISNFLYFYSHYFYKDYPSINRLVSRTSKKSKKIFESFDYYEIFQLFKKNKLRLNFFIFEEFSGNPKKFIKKLSNFFNYNLKITETVLKQINSKDDLVFKFRKYKITSKKIKNQLNFSNFPEKIKKLNTIVKRIYLDKKINKIKIDKKIKNKIRYYFRFNNRKLDKNIKLPKSYF